MEQSIPGNNLPIFTQRNVAEILLGKRPRKWGLFAERTRLLAGLS